MISLCLLLSLGAQPWTALGYTRRPSTTLTWRSSLATRGSSGTRFTGGRDTRPSRCASISTPGKEAEKCRLCCSVLTKEYIIYILTERTAPARRLKLRRLSLPCLVCILHMHNLSVCIAAARAGGERRLNFRRRGVLSDVRSQRIYFLW